MIKNNPLIAVSMGDPSGIGPEIALDALASVHVRSFCRPLLVGDYCAARRALQGSAHPETALHLLSDPAQAAHIPDGIALLDSGCLTESELRLGQVDARCGDAAFQYVKKTIELALSGQVDATVTCPISKEAINLAGHSFSGHTEIYAHYTNTPRYSMMLAHGPMRVVHVSTHVSLREACDRVKKERVLEVIRLADSACKELGIAAPRVAVAGLNPHCGENGLFGREETDEIQPAVEQARREGIDTAGPIPPDTVFCRLRAEQFDICVCMYHDQGHIPLKLTGFVWDGAQGRWASVSGVNITLGLPIIRVSVDHGTAFDIAGQGIASSDSLVSALEYAARFAKHRARPHD